MKNIKMIALIGLYSMISISIFAANNAVQAEKDKIEQFLPYATEDYEYSRLIDYKIAPADVQDSDPVVIYDKIRTHYLDTGTTRTKITKEIKQGKVIVTTETWVSKKTSYFTKINIAAAVTIIATLAMAGILKNITDNGFGSQNRRKLGGYGEYKDTTIFDWLLNTEKYKEADLVAHHNYFKAHSLRPFDLTGYVKIRSKEANEWLIDNKDAFVHKFGQNEYDRQKLLNDLHQKALMVRCPSWQNPSYHPAELQAFLEQNKKKIEQLLVTDSGHQEYALDDYFREVAKLMQ